MLKAYMVNFCAEVSKNEQKYNLSNEKLLSIKLVDDHFSLKAHFMQQDHTRQECIYHHLLYYKTLGKLRIRRMFSELMVRSTTYYIPADSACNGGCHRPSGTLIHSLYGYLGRIKDLSYL